ncbi:BP74-related protein [Pseudomonas marvdashtae]|uniref:BP74-related protein n=1 Tax=Pseudomonas marvdashtae TaxID=2745500 RepID=UPI003F5930D5
MSSTAIAEPNTRYFSFVTQNGFSSPSGDTSSFGPHEFVVAIDNPALADQISAVISNNIQPGDPFMIMGKIVRERKPYNERWPFHLAPESISLFANQQLDCDGAAFTVEDNIELVGAPGSGVLPDGVWCPWTSRFVREIYYRFPL